MNFTTFISVCWTIMSVSSLMHYTVLKTHNRFKSDFKMTGEESPSIAGFSSFIERKTRPDHLQIPRKRMELTFSVQLMRLSYSVVDDLDFVPMDEFQKDFFLFRQDEWQDYKGYHPTVMQGDLADPLYFDFISFAQYVVIGDKMRRGQQEFVERNGAEGEASVIRRDPRYTDNKLLPVVHSTIFGEKMIDFIYEKYPASILPPLSLSAFIDTKEAYTASKTKLISNMQMLLDIFTINSYCLSTEMSEVLPSTKGVVSKGVTSIEESLQTNPLIAKIIVRAPSNLWSEQALRKRNENPVNNFEIKVLAALVKRWGLTLETVSTNVVNKIDVVHVIKLV